MSTTSTVILSRSTGHRAACSVLVVQHQGWLDYLHPQRKATQTSPEFWRRRRSSPGPAPPRLYQACLAAGLGTVHLHGPKRLPHVPLLYSIIPLPTRLGRDLRLRSVRGWSQQHRQTTTAREAPAFAVIRILRMPVPDRTLLRYHIGLYPHRELYHLVHHQDRGRRNAGVQHRAELHRR